VVIDVRDFMSTDPSAVALVAIASGI